MWRSPRSSSTMASVPPALEQASVLVAIDEGELRRHVSLALWRAGHMVETVGEEWPLQKRLQCGTAGGAPLPDLIVWDVRLASMLVLEELGRALCMPRPPVVLFVGAVADVVSARVTRNGRIHWCGRSDAPAVVAAATALIAVRDEQLFAAAGAAG
jgi:CheY-like chemotaxis protein